MSIKHKIADLQVLLKNDRKTQAIAVIGLLMVLFVMFYDDGRGRRQVSDNITPLNTGAGETTDYELSSDILTRFNTDLGRLEDTTIKNAKMIEDLSGNIAVYEDRTAQIFKKILERISEIDSNTNVGNASGSAYPEAPYYEDSYTADSRNRNADAAGKYDAAGSFVPATAAGGALPPVIAGADPDEGLESFGDPDFDVDVATGEPEPNRIAVIGPGDSVRIKLLAGVNAPTDGRPYPVVMKLIGDVTGPDGTQLPLGEARITAAAQGSITDQRAQFRLDKMNIRLPTGEIREVAVDGWIVGEDGILGMPGVLIDPFPKILGGAVLAGGIGGIGSALQASNITTNQNNQGGITSAVTGNTLEFGAGQGISDGAQLWQEYIREKANEFTPVVKVFSNREATAIFSQSVEIPGLYEALGNTEDDAFAELD